MSTSTTTTYDYNQAGLGAYNQLQSPMANVLLQLMKNPMQSTFFNQRQQLLNKQIGQQGSRNARNILANASLQGYSNLPGFTNSMLNAAARGTSAQQSNAFLNNLNYMTGMQFGATQAAEGYRPLMMGETQSTSGTGTWLPQVLGAGVSGLMGLATGGGISPFTTAGGANPQMPYSGAAPTGPSGVFGTVPGMPASWWGYGASTPGSVYGLSTPNAFMYPGMMGVGGAS